MIAKSGRYMTMGALCLVAGVMGQAATIDLAEHGGAYTVTAWELPADFIYTTDFTNSASEQATLTFDFNVTATNAGSIAGNIKVIKKGSKELLLTKTSAFTGGTEIQAGAIYMSADNALGSGLVTMSSGTTLLLESGATCPNDIYFAGGTCKLTFGTGGGTYAGDITGAAGATLGLAQPSMNSRDSNYFTGAITLPGSNLSMPDGQACRFRFYGPVTVAYVKQDSAYHRTAPIFYATNNSFSCLYIKRQQSSTYPPYFAEDAMPHDCCITCRVANAEGNKLTQVEFSGRQRFRYVTSESGFPITLAPFSGVSGASCDLTLTDSENGPDVCLNGAMNLTYAPEDGGTWTLTNGTSTMTGTLTITNATMAITQNAKFTKVSRIVLAAGGTLEVDEMAASSFPPKDCAVVIKGDGKIKVPSDLTITLPLLLVDGVYVAGGTYTSDNCSWVTGGGSVKVTNASISSWKDAVDGLWSDASKWVAGTLPGTETTYITAERQSYTVTADVDVLTPKTTLIGNANGHTSTVAVTSNIRLADTSTVVTVERGGVFDVQGGTFSASNALGRVCSVADGGIWRVSGGTCDFKTKNSSLTVKSGGRIEMTSGQIILQDIKNTYSSPFYFNDGIIDITGGMFKTINNEGEFNPLGSGEITVGGTGVLYIARGYYMGPRTAGHRLHIVTQDEGVLTGGILNFCGVVDGGETLIELYSSKATYFGYLGMVGCNRASRVQVDVHSGSALGVGGYGLYVGTTHSKKDTVACFPTGVVNVVGGTCTVDGTWYQSNNGRYGNAGTIIGGNLTTNTTYNSKAYTCLQYGELNLTEGGTFKQESGIFGVGLVNGKGKVTLDGASSITKKQYGEALIGAFGGEGLLTIAGGSTVQFTWNMFIGGIEHDSISSPHEAETGRDYYVDFDTTAAVGLVEVSDGTLKVSRLLTLGEMGRGTLKVGPAGLVKAANLTLKDNLSSELVFKAGESGVGSIVVSDTLTISPQAKLTIDLTDYVGRFRRAKLLSATTYDGTFSAANVTITGRKGAYLEYAADGIYVCGAPEGLKVIIR